MPSKVIMFLVLIVVVVLAAGMLYIGGHSASNTQGSSYVNNTNATAANSTAILFANTQYAPFAYLVSSGTLSSGAQAALSGFNLSRAQYNNGTVKMTITLTANGGSQIVTLKPGYKLYIIEASFGDDSFGGESNLGDDGFVEVSPNGYIVQ